MGMMRVRASQTMNGGCFHLGVLVGPAFEACEHVPTRAAEPCGLGHGTPSTYIQPNVTRPCASATVWGVWEWKEGGGSMGISVLMPGLIISLVECFSPIEVFQPTPTLGIALTTIRRVKVY